MSTKLFSLTGVLLAGALSSCSAAQPSATAPDTSAAPADPPPASAPAPVAPASAPADAPAPAEAPSDPLLKGMTGEDLDWGKKCLGGNGTYCTKFGNVAEFKTADFPTALVWYKKGCEAQKPEPVSCMGVARLTIQGQGTPADVDGGLKIWTATCSMDGGRDSCTELAMAYEKGRWGLKKDPGKAKEIFNKLCALGSANACKKVGKPAPKP